MLLYGGIVLAVLIVAGGVYWYIQRQHAERQAALYQALRIQDAQIGPSTSEFLVMYSTQEAKNKAVTEAMTSLAAKYSGSEEAAIAQFYLGVNAADQSRLGDAEKHWLQVAGSGEEAYASLAKLSLAELYQSQGKVGEAEKLLRSLIDNPT